PAFAGERVPTLAEVLAFVEGRPPLGATIEAKGEGTGPVIARAVLGSPARGRLSICSFDPVELRAAAAIAPGMPRVFIADRNRPDADLLAETLAASASACNVPLDWCTPE